MLEGQELWHIYYVLPAGGLLILGEKQILGQIKEAVEFSRQHLIMDKTFNIFTNFVLETGKKAGEIPKLILAVLRSVGPRS